MFIQKSNKLTAEQLKISDNYGQGLSLPHCKT